jgi:hypothetical protein
MAGRCTKLLLQVILNGLVFAKFVVCKVGDIAGPVARLVVSFGFLG